MDIQRSRALVVDGRVGGESEGFAGCHLNGLCARARGADIASEIVGSEICTTSQSYRSLIVIKSLRRKLKGLFTSDGGVIVGVLSDYLWRHSMLVILS